MPPSTQSTTVTGPPIPRTPGSLILLLPTDAHPDLYNIGCLGQWTTEPLRGGARSVDPMTGDITYHETASVRTATDFGGDVYVNTISGLKATSHLDEEDKKVLRDLYYKSRDIYRKTPKNVDSKSPESEWDAEHGSAFSNAFFSAMRELDPHRGCKAGMSCKTGKRTRPGASCQPSKPALRGLAINPRVLTAKSLVTFRGHPSLDPAYDFHTIEPTQRANSSTMPPVTHGTVSNCGSGEMTLPPGMVVFGTGAL